MGKKNTIELNGKRYNAATGAFLGSSPSNNSFKDFKKYSPKSHSGRVMDGFKKVNPAKNINKTAIMKPVQAIGAGLKPSARQMDMVNPKRIGRATAIAAASHIPQPTKTLMRSVVKKPDYSLKPAIKTQLPVSRNLPDPQSIMPVSNNRYINQARAERAKSSHINQKVKRYDINSSSVSSNKPRNNEQASQNQQMQASEQDDDIFETAIGQARSHEQPAPKVKLRRSPLKKVLNGLSLVCACLVIAIFVAYLNLPNLELHFASVRAGFHATLPGYKSLGFKLDGPISSRNGVVAMSFHSGDSEFTLTQEASNWDNQTLLDSATSQSGTPPRVLQSDGRTVYLPSGNSATWVSGGIRYILTGNANLNDQQISSIADSM